MRKEVIGVNINKKAEQFLIYSSIAIVVVLLLLFAFILNYPKSQADYVAGVVVSRALDPGGYGPSGEFLTVKINNDVKETVLTMRVTGVKLGESVKLSVHESYFLSPKYQFISTL